MNEQMDLFGASYEEHRFPKKIRLIELFAGIGAQAKALEILGCDFDHWRTCEWSWQSIVAYNAIHMGGRSKDTSSLSYEEVIARISGISNDYNKPMTEKEIRRRGESWAREVLGKMLENNNLCPNVSKLKGEDLGIVDKDTYTYLMTYSFPCQDLSNAGQMKGFEKGHGTRSGLLWEVERILLELKQTDSLPQILIMENVPGVCGSKNTKPWSEWLESLSEMGYVNYAKILNAKDYGIPQNRNRCFMVSLLGNYSFNFPRKLKLRYLLKDFIEDKVDECYYLPDELVSEFEKYVDGAQSDENPS